MKIISADGAVIFWNEPEAWISEDEYDATIAATLRWYLVACIRARIHVKIVHLSGNAWKATLKEGDLYGH